MEWRLHRSRWDDEDEAEADDAEGEMRQVIKPGTAGWREWATTRELSLRAVLPIIMPRENSLTPLAHNSRDIKSFFYRSNFKQKSVLEEKDF